MTTFEEFRELAEGVNVVPVVEPFMADTETPVSVYVRLRELSPYSFLLESVDGGKVIARYSFLGVDPFMIARIHDRRLSIEAIHEDVSVLPSLVDPSDHPLEGLKKIFRHFKTPRIPGVPRFTGGAVGFMGFETVGLVESVPVSAAGEEDLPDALLMFCDTIVIFDNVLRQMFLISNAYLPMEGRTEQSVRTEYEKAVREIARLKAILAQDIDDTMAVPSSIGTRVSEVSRQQYEEWVRCAVEYIRAGDIFQVVLAQRVHQSYEGDLFSIYRTLRQLNPSPYMYYLSMGESAIIGASPEMLVRVDHETVETRPIAGTRRRGRTQAEDEQLAAELLADEKERAEHLMLVDLGRNDLGRICRYGSVSVTEFMSVEYFSHVMHLVSSVQGLLREGITALEALMACFPAGTLSGAPKIRALEVIHELEGRRRGVYGGAICYFDFSGNMDSCIAIRTVVAHRGELTFQSGAGIVLDSNPGREYEETEQKLASSIGAVEAVGGAS